MKLEDMKNLVGLIDAGNGQVVIDGEDIVKKLVAVVEEAECTQEGNDCRTNLYKALKALEEA